MNDLHEPAANDDIMELEAAAEFLRLDYKAMKELIDAGEIPALSCHRKHTVTLRADLSEYARTEGRNQAQKRKRKKTAAAPANLPGSRRVRRSLPDLTPYEIAAGVRRKG